MVGVDRPMKAPSMHIHTHLIREKLAKCMDYNSISIKPYIKSHLELQREITLLIELAPSPYGRPMKAPSMHIQTPH